MENESKICEAILRLKDFTAIPSLDPSRIYIITNKKTEMSIYIRQDNGHFRASIGGLYAKGIRISVKKTPERIANEIQKRLIDKNMVIFEETKAQNKATTKYETMQNKMFLDTSEMLNHYPHESERRQQKGYTKINEINVEYKPFYNNLKVTLSDLPLPLFDKMVDLIKKETTEKMWDWNDKFTITFNRLFEEESPEYSDHAPGIAEDIRQQINDGNDYAWFCAEVVAEFHGITSSAFLGNCSYDSESSFKSDGCYNDLVLEAKDELQGKLEKLVADLGIL